MKKTPYSLAPLRELLLAANRRYVEFISSIENDRTSVPCPGFAQAADRLLKG